MGVTEQRKRRKEKIRKTALGHSVKKMRGLVLVVVLVLGLVNGRAVEDEADIAEKVAATDDAEGDDEGTTKAPYVPGGDKTPFLRGGPGGQGYNPGNDGGQGYNPGNNGGQGYPHKPDLVPPPCVTNNGGQGYNPGNNGGQGYNPGNNGGHGYNPGGYNPGGRNGDEIHFPGNGIGGRSQFRTPIVFADDEDTSNEGQAKPSFQAVGTLGGPQLSVKAQGAPQGVQTLPGFPARLPARRPYVPGQDKRPLLRGQQEVYVQEPGAPGGPWDGTTVALLLQPKDFNPAIQAGSVQTLPSPIQFVETPQFRKLRPSPVQAQLNPQIQSGLAQTLPSPIQFVKAHFNPQIQAGVAHTLPSSIQFAEEEPKVLLLQPIRSQLSVSGPQTQGRAPGAQQGVQTLPSPIQFASTRQEYVPGGDKTPYLRPTSTSPQIQAGLAQTLPSGVQFAGDAQTTLSGTDKGPYLSPQQQPKVIVVTGQSGPTEGFEGKSSLPAAQDERGYPYPGITYPYFKNSATPPFRSSPTIIYIF